MSLEQLSHTSKQDNAQEMCQEETEASFEWNDTDQIGDNLNIKVSNYSNRLKPIKIISVNTESLSIYHLSFVYLNE